MNRQIFRIAIPNILSNITIPLLGIVDTILMGYQAENATILIGAIGLGGVIFNAIYWNFGFIRVATTGITAQAFGEENQEKQAITLFRALALALVLSALILSVKGLIEQFGFSLITRPENAEAINYAQDYFRVRIWAVPAVMLLFGLRGWFYGMQNAVFPFILTTVVNLVNVGASIYFVRYKHMSADGVALGTVVAQYSCLIVAFALLFYRYSWIGSRVHLNRLTKGLSEFFKVSGFVFGRNIMLFAVFATFTYYSSTIDPEYFAVNQILLELFYLMSFAVDGFAYASEALVGRFVGARQSQNVLLAVRLTLFWGVSFGVLYSVLYQVFGEQFLSLFSPDRELISTGQSYLIWLSIISIVGAVAFIWDGVYVGATLVQPMFGFMTLSTAFFFIILYTLHNQFPKQAIWAALTGYMLLRGLLQSVFFYSIAQEEFE